MNVIDYYRRYFICDFQKNLTLSFALWNIFLFMESVLGCFGREMLSLTPRIIS